MAAFGKPPQQAQGPKQLLLPTDPADEEAMMLTLQAM